MHVYDLACLVAAAERAAKLSHCARKACPFSTVQDTGLCRGHLADATSQVSYLPSSLGLATVPQPAARVRHAHA